MSTVIYIGIAHIAVCLVLHHYQGYECDHSTFGLMSIILIEYSGFHKRGLKGFLHSFAEPVPIMLPINILELAISDIIMYAIICNVPGSFQKLSGTVELICPAILPLPFSLYFDFFDGFIQAYDVFAVSS